MGMKEIFESLTETILGTSGVKAVYGEPVEAQGKTIIPVAKAAYGFGGGCCEPKGDKKEVKEGECGGMGGGVAVKPVGVLEITKDETRYIPLGNKKKLAVVLILGFLLGLLFGRK
jgi:uncharacterized spore protein YtfJ